MKRMTLLTATSLMLPCAAIAQGVTITQDRVQLEHFAQTRAGDLYVLAEQSFDGSRYIEIQPRIAITDTWAIASAIELPQDKRERFLLGVGYSRKHIKVNLYARDDVTLHGYSYQATIIGDYKWERFNLSGFADLATQEGRRDAFAHSRVSLTYGKSCAFGVEYAASTERADAVSVLFRIGL